MITLASALMLALAFAARAQPVQSNRTVGQRFEVASIKPTKECAGRGGTKTGGPPGGGGRGMSESPGRIEWNCATVAGLIKEAYGTYANGRVASVMYSPPPIQGGPPWINSDTYHITAKAENAANLGMMNGPMLQALLEDRFKLKIHRGTRQVQVYALKVTKSGPKLRQFQEGSCTPLDFTRPPGSRQPGSAPYCNMMIRMIKPDIGAVDMRPATLEEFSKALTRVVGRPVIDKTGIQGAFEFYVEFALDQSTPGLAPPPGASRPPIPDDPSGGRSIFTAVQEQLGLKLEATKGPTDILVIDHVEKASEN